MNVTGAGQTAASATPLTGATRRDQLNYQNNRRNPTPEQGAVDVARLPGAQPLNSSGRGQHINLVV